MKKRKELTLEEVVASLANNVPVYVVCRLDPDVRKWPAGAEGFFCVTEEAEDTQEPTPVADIAKGAKKAGRPKKVGKDSKDRIDDGKIRALFEAGWNLSSIALEAGCSAQTVRSHLETMGLLEVRPQDVVEKTE